MSGAAELPEPSAVERTASTQRADDRAHGSARVFQKTLSEHANDPRLQALLHHAMSEGLIPEFAMWDERAKEYQQDHRRLVWRAVLGGVGGAVLGIVRFIHAALWVSVLEMACFVYAAVAVFRGLTSSRRDRWLLARYEAERRRLKLFELASDPATWQGKGPADWGAYVRAGMDALPHITNIESLTHDETAPTLVDPRECSRLGRPELTALVRFYREGHLDVQMKYFEGQTKSGPANRILRKEWVSYVFFGFVVVFALLHVGIEAAEHVWKIANSERLAMTALAISAVVAGIWAAVRTLRSANEFVRNTTRAEAKLSVLKGHCELLERELARPEPDSWRIFMTLRLCDAVLRSDQREWVGLMHEAEWF